MLGVNSAGLDASARRLTTVVAADICGYSALAEADEKAAVEAVAAVRGILETVANNHRGRIFHQAGDGFLAEFPTAAEGVEAALAFISEVRRRRTHSPAWAHIAVRAGVHAGDVTEGANGDLLGHCVNVAARLQGQADPDTLLGSSHIANLVRGKVAARFGNRRLVELRNIDEPVIAFEVIDGSRAPPRGMAWPRIRIRRSALALVAAGAAFIAVNAGLMAYFDRADHGNDPLGGRSAMIADALLQKRVEEVQGRLYGYVSPAADLILLVATEDAARSLLASEVPEKRLAVDLILKNDLSGAAGVLEEVYKRQVEATTIETARVQTLKELGAVIFNYDTPMSIRTYRKIHELSPNDPITLYQLGRLYLRVNDPDTAQSYFTALGLAVATDAPMALRARVGVINSRLRRNDLEGLESDLRAALADARALKLPAEEADVLAAYAAFMQGRNMKAAISYQKRALILEQAIGRQDRLLKALSNFGAMLIETGDQAEAEKTLMRGLALSREQKDRRAEGSILLNLAFLSIDQRAYSRARDHASEALLIGRAEGRPNLVAASLEILGEAAAAMSEFAQACRLFAESLRAYQDTPYSGDPPVKPKLEKIGCRH